MYMEFFRTPPNQFIARKPLGLSSIISAVLGGPFRRDSETLAESDMSAIWSQSCINATQISFLQKIRPRLVASQNLNASLLSVGVSIEITNGYP